MPRRYSVREVTRALESLGFERLRQRGSHIRYRGSWRGQQRNVSLVSGQREVPAPTLASIIGPAGLTPEEFQRLVDGERVVE